MSVKTKSQKTTTKAPKITKPDLQAQIDKLKEEVAKLQASFTKLEERVKTLEARGLLKVAPTPTPTVVPMPTPAAPTGSPN